MKTTHFLSMFLFCAFFSSAQLDTIGRPGFRLLGKPVPDFTATTIDGKAIDADYFKNKTTVIVFMSPGCAPCRYELPKLDQWTKTFSKDTFQILLLYDSDAAYTRDFRSAKSRKYGKIKKKFGLDSLAFDCVAECAMPDRRIIGKSCMAVATKFNVNGWPSTFFVSKDGIVRNYESGYELGNTHGFDMYFDELLKLTVKKESYVYRGQVYK